MGTKAPYKPMSTVSPVMPEQARQDDRKGTVPKAHKVQPTLADLYRTETVHHAKASGVHYKERGI